MKRIIELPDNVVKAIQNGEDYRYDIHTAIAQSEPYNPTGDLISREALRERKTPQVTIIGGRRNTKTTERLVEVYQKGWNDCIDAIIANAPTIGKENE